VSWFSAACWDRPSSPPLLEDVKMKGWSLPVIGGAYQGGASRSLYLLVGGTAPLVRATVCHCAPPAAPTDQSEDEQLHLHTVGVIQAEASRTTSPLDTEEATSCTGLAVIKQRLLWPRGDMRGMWRGGMQRGRQHQSSSTTLLLISACKEQAASPHHTAAFSPSARVKGGTERRSIGGDA
ncbi:hypothetical protein P4O66_013666, partial [Electrophorus voltai]